MPVIPSHTGFAATPNTASAFLGGARISADIAQDSNRLQMEARRIQLQRDALAQEAQQAQMQLQAKEAQAERQALRDQQQMEMEKAYQQAQIGLRQRELQGEEKALQFKTQEAAQKSMAQQMYQAKAQRLMTEHPDMNPQEAYQQAALEFGPQMNLPSGAYTAAFRGRGGGAEFGGATPVSGLPDQYRQVQTGPGTRRILRVPDSVTGTETATPIPGAKGYVEYHGKTLRVPDETRPIQTQLTKLEAAHEKDTPGRLAAQKAADPKKKMTSTDKLALESYRAREKKITELEEEIRAIRKGGPASAPTNAAPKRFVWDSKQKKLVPK